MMPDRRAFAPFVILSAVACAAVCGLATAAAGPATAPTTAPSQPAPFAFLNADVHRVPIKMVGPFPFVAASVNGTAGKLMFDTGSERALALNDQRVHLEGGKVIGQGFVGSGQRFETKRYPVAQDVTIEGGLRYPRIPDVEGQDYGFIAKGVTPDFLGFLGHNFYAGYLFKLDYGRGEVTFYRQTAARRESKDYLKGETILGTSDFETRKLPNHPIVKLSIGGVPFVGAFDTGQQGGIVMTEDTQAKLAARGLLAPTPGSKTGEFDVKGLSVTPSLTVSLSNVRVSHKPSPAAGPIGITEENAVDLGYAFLAQFKTVWDFKAAKIYLLKL